MKPKPRLGFHVFPTPVDGMMTEHQHLSHTGVSQNVLSQNRYGHDDDVLLIFPLNRALLIFPLNHLLVTFSGWLGVISHRHSSLPL